MSFGVVEGMVVLYTYLFAYLGILAVAVVVSIVFSFRKRQVIVWTQVVALLALPFLLGPWQATIIAFGIWLLIAWPWQAPRDSEIPQATTPRALILIAQPAAVTVASCVLLVVVGTLGLWALQGLAPKGQKPRGVSTPRLTAIRPVAVRPAAVRPAAVRPAAASPTASAPGVEPAVLQSPPGPIAENLVAAHLGMTWVVRSRLEEEGRSYVLVGTDNASNAYKGDTPPTTELPLLAIRPTDSAKPTIVDSPHWAGGEVRLTEPVAASRLRSLAEANAKIREELGAEWRMASFHDGIGWRFWAEGTLDTSESSRFWVTIRDQKANPWDRLVQASSGS